MTEPVAEGVVGRPRGAASPWVSSYVGYRYEGFAAGEHTGMPAPALTFIISLGDPVDIVGMPGGRQGPGAFQAFVDRDRFPRRKVTQAIAQTSDVDVA